MKKLITLLSIPLIAGALNSCNVPNGFYNCKEKDNLYLKAWRNGAGSDLRVEYRSNSDRLNDSTAYIFATDNEPFRGYGSKEMVLGDGRFDIIELNNVPKGHPLEKYANLDSINKLFKEVEETGCDCETYSQRKKKGFKIK